MDMRAHQRSQEAAFRRLAAEKKQEDDERTTVRAFLWTLLVFKLVTLGALVIWVSPTEILALGALVGWPWLIIPCILMAGPIGSRMRRRAVRKRRKALQRAEWNVEPTSRAFLLNVQGAEWGTDAAHTDPEFR